MKNSWLIPLLILISLQPLSAMDKILDWNIIHPIQKNNIHLGIKGSVQEALIQIGELPDPHIQMNEKLFDWIEEHQWEFHSNFTLSEQELNDKIIDIELPNVDTYAEVYLNGHHILSCTNAFLPYRLNINKWAQRGLNEIKVVFTPPVMYHKEMYNKASYKLPAPNDVHKIAIAPYTRKPQYQFGWDWALRMNTIGFNKPVTITLYEQNKIIHSSIQTIQVSEGKATVSFEVQFAQPIEQLIWNSSTYGKINWTPRADNWIAASIEIENPQLWWPVNYGDPFLYTDNWTFSTSTGQPIDQITKRFGIRTARLLQPQDEFGTAYEIEVNGLKIFCKGGDYIPQEIFPARVTDEMVKNLIYQMKAANFNMVRIWGGGYYPDEVFFNTCDELGIMVWEDFMFACAMYPGTTDFLENVRREIDYHIPRMTSHPSVVLLNGNNEVMIAWKNWGFQLKYGLIGKSVTEIEKAYDDLFKTLIPNRVAYFTHIPYVHTSPLSHWGKNEYYNHGSQHYWGVWHGKDPIEDFGNKIGRFNAEYGFQSFPEYSTLSAVIDEKDWNLNSDVMKLRQKSYVGNGMIKKHSDNLFGKTDDFKTFIYYSQLTQSKAVSLAIAGHRADWPRCTGTLYWQINDCWPSPTWSSIDYYGNWKALHYEVKKDFENIAVVAVEKKLNQKQFYLIADWTKEYNNEVIFDFYDLSGTWLEQHSFFVDVRSQTVTELPVFDLMQQKLDNYIVQVKWKNKQGQQLTRTFHNYTSLDKLPKTGDFSINLKTGENGKQQIELTTTSPLFNCWIFSEKTPFHLPSNFETLLPGKYVFDILSNQTLELSEIQIKVLNR